VISPAWSPPQRLRWTVDLLDVGPTEHLLEVGCGPGHAVALVCSRLTHGTVTAIDRSAAMIARARARNAPWVAAGRARIEQQALTTAALGRRFAKSFAVNVNAFWTTPGPSLAALRRLLDPAGLAYLAYEPPTPERRDELRRSLPGLLETHGFEVVDVHARRFRVGHGFCIVGRAAAVPRTRALERSAAATGASQHQVVPPPAAP
jgi:SAM-dependent methyltransferase